MSRGRHAAERTSTVGLEIGRALALLVIGVAVGFFVLHRLPGSAPAASGGSSPGSTPRTTTAGTTTRATTPASRTTAGTGTTSVTVAPSKVTTLVANGTAVPGAAGKVGTSLGQHGYHVLSPVNASSPVSSSQVYFASGYAEEASAVASSLSLPPSDVSAMPSPPPVSSSQSADVLVVVGPDLAARLSGSPGS
ncbi:MAG: LytR C-terminal domain-containing protein [Acidimicrobiales bacterium]